MKKNNLLLTNIQLIIVSMYSLDFHRLVYNTIIALFGAQEALGKNVKYIDYVFVLLSLIIIIYNLYDAYFRVKNVNFILDKIKINQFIFIGLYIINIFLIENSSFSRQFFMKFLLGNLLLFLIGELIIRKENGINVFLSVTLIMILLMATISIYFYIIGATYTSIRAKIIPNMDIRSGYFPAMYLIYIFITKVSNQKIVNRKFWIVISLIIYFVVMVSGSKASFLLSTILMIIYFAKYSYKIKLNKKIVLPLILVPVILLALIFILDKGKYGSNLFSFKDYYVSIQSRVELFSTYFISGIKKPIFGNGISASYNISTVRTHSLIAAFITQLGLPGLTLYLAMIYYSFASLIKLINSHKKNNICVFALLFTFIFAVIFGEIALDIIGNRIIWLFVGLINELNNTYGHLRNN